ncbi:MAG TPA: class I SAM-dependent methyltransferase [Gaiellaceae bacterium]
MAFDVGADAYDKFMGRYSVQLSPQFADFGGVAAGDHVLDVGCGPGALTAELLQRGAVVSAADPSPQFVAAARERYPDVDVQQATAEELPYADGSFDEVLAQLVVHFMADPVHGLSEMARVTRNGGVVAACVWDIAGDRAPITPYWQAAKALDPTTQDERRAGAGEGQLPELFRQAGLEDVEETPLPVHVQHPTFEEWWLPFTLGVGPAGAHYQQLDPAHQQALEQHLREQLGQPVELEARAWAARGIARRP